MIDEVVISMVRLVKVYHGINFSISWKLFLWSNWINYEFQSKTSRLRYHPISTLNRGKREARCRHANAHLLSTDHFTIAQLFLIIDDEMKVNSRIFFSF